MSACGAVSASVDMRPPLATTRSTWRCSATSLTATLKSSDCHKATANDCSGRSSALRGRRRKIRTQRGRPTRPAAERRAVAVMFCDPVGSSALASRLDKEDWCPVNAQLDETSGVPLVVKDLRLALAEGERTTVPVPAASLLRETPRGDRGARLERSRWRCHVAKPRARSVGASGIVRPLRLRSATWSSRQREARGTLGRVCLTFRACGRRHRQVNLQIKHEIPAERSGGSRRPDGKLM